jgi:hypothetical protein
LNYFTTIEQFFLSLKGSCLALSASDYQLISEWESRKIPIELICRSIETSYYRFEERSNRRSGKISLIQIQEVIEQEIQEAMYKQ